MSLAELDTSTSKVPASQIPWAELWDGIEIKVLRIGEKTGTYTLMSRFAPGTVLPKHRHFGEVHAYTISGTWNYKEYDWVAEAGDYAYEPPNSTHTLQVPADATEPAVVIFVIDKGMVLLDDDDNLFMIEDAWSVFGYYRQALEARGIPVPDGILP